MLEQLFGSKTRVKLLCTFFQFPEKSFYVRELARTIDSQLNAVRRELANLEKIGLIAPVSASDAECLPEASGTSRAKYYRMDQSCLLFFELKSLLIKVQTLQEREMTDMLKERAGKIKLLLLTGVFTGEEDVETDMLLVGDVRPVVIQRVIGEFEKKLGKSIRYTTMNENEFFERKDIGDKFLYTLFEGKHVTVLDELTGQTE